MSRRGPLSLTFIQALDDILGLTQRDTGRGNEAVGHAGMEAAKRSSAKAEAAQKRYHDRVTSRGSSTLSTGACLLPLAPGVRRAEARGLHGTAAVDESGSRSDRRVLLKCEVSRRHLRALAGSVRPPADRLKQVLFAPVLGLAAINPQAHPYATERFKHGVPGQTGKERLRSHS